MYKGEYKGGFYVFVILIGGYIRYIIFTALKNNIDIKYLLGDDVGKFNSKQRVISFVVGITTIFLCFVLLSIIALFFNSLS